MTRALRTNTLVVTHLPSVVECKLSHTSAVSGETRNCRIVPLPETKTERRTSLTIAGYDWLVHLLSLTVSPRTRIGHVGKIDAYRTNSIHATAR